MYALAEEFNARAGRRQVDTLDLGGGLPVYLASDATAPTYAQYARVLREAVPGLFGGRYGLVTEFGRSLLAEHGTAARSQVAGRRSQVADITLQPDPTPSRRLRRRRVGGTGLGSWPGTGPVGAC